MVDELFFDGARYISAADAAGISNLTRDYIARLAREGKIVGKQVGRGWYVSQESLRTFLVAQEYSNSQRRDALVRERQQEYGRVQGSVSSKMADPATSAPASVVAGAAGFSASADSGELHRKLVRAAASGGAQIVSKISTAATNAAGQVPLYAVSPGLELLHKVAAAVLAVTLVVGLYGVGNSLTATSPESASASVTPQIELGAAAGLLRGTFSDIASTMRRGIDAFVAPLFGVHFASTNSPQAIVAVDISSGGSSAPSRIASAASTPANSTNETIINNPIVERVVDTEEVIASGGITEGELDQKLQELDNQLSEKFYEATAANSTAIAQNYNVTAQTNAIDQLNGTAISNASISGGSIANASITGGTISGATINGATFSGTTTLDALVVSGAATSSYSAGIDLASGCFAIAGTCITSGGGGAGNPGGSDTQVQFNDNGNFNGSPAFTFSTSTATLSVLNASTTNASSTNFFAAAASFTNGIFSSLSSTFVSITGLTATNSTTTSATTTNLYVSGDLGLGRALPIASGGTGTSTAPNYGQLLVGNGSGGYNLLATSSLGIASSGGSSASSTLLIDNNTFTGSNLFLASTTIGSGIAGLTVNGNATTTGVAYFAGDVGIGTTTPGSIFSVQGVGNFVGGATSTLYNGLNVTGGCVAVNGTCLGSGSGSSNTSTSSANSWSALQIFAGGASTTNLSVFGNAYFGGTATSSFNSAGQLALAGIQNSLLSTNASGQVVSTSTIGSNLLSVPSNSLLAGNSSGQLVATTSIGSNLLTGTLGVGNGGTGIASTPSYGNLLVGNGTNYTLTATSSLGLPQFSDLSSQIAAAYEFPGNATSTTLSFNSGLTAFASSTIGNGTAGLTVNGGATTTGRAYFAGNVGIGTTSPSATFGVAGNTFLGGNLILNGVTNSLLATNASGQIVATTSIGTNLLTGTLGTINGASFTAGGSITVSSTTLLANNNTFSGSNIFTGATTLANATSSAFAITSLANSILAVNGSGSVVSTSTLSSNLLIVPANSLLAGNGSGALVATTSIGTNLLTGTLATINTTAITPGGTFTITAASSSLLGDNNTFSGTDLFTPGASFGAGGVSNFNSAGDLGLGTTSPSSLLSLQGGNEYISNGGLNINSVSFLPEITASVTPELNSTIEHTFSGNNGLDVPLGLAVEMNPASSATYNHAVGILGDVLPATSSTNIGIEGRIDNPVNGGTNYGILGLSTLDSNNNGSSTAVGVWARAILGATSTVGSNEGEAVGILASGYGGATDYNGIFGAGTTAGDNGWLALRGYITAASSMAEARFRVDDSTQTLLAQLTDPNLNGMMIQLRDTAGASAFRVVNSATSSLLTALSNGDVGVGTSTPFAELTVATPNGSNGATSNLFLISSSTASATTTLFDVTNAGNVGIGTSTPGSILSIGNTGGINFSTATSTFNSTGGINLTSGCYAINGTCIGGGSSASSTLLIDNNTFSGSDVFTKALDLNGGFLSLASSTVGNGNQNGGLTINGGATTTGATSLGGNLTFSSDNSYDIGASGANRPRNVYTAGYVLASNGLYSDNNIGIDSSSNLSAPDGDGTFRLTDNLGTNFDRLEFGGGTSAFPALARSGAGIVFELADQSGLAAIQAGNASTSLLSVGNGSATTTVSDATSTFAGGISLDSGCVQVNGSCIVSSAFTLDGSNNLFAESGALSNLTSGTNNIAAGTNALEYNTSGLYNIALGGSALLSNDNGEFNIAVGPSSLLNTDGGYNVALGEFSLRNLGSGYYNIALGSEAGANLSSGSNNILIGAGASGNGVYAPNSSGSNQLNIGNLIYGSGLDGDSATVSTGDIGIGTTSPYARFSIAGTSGGTAALFAVSSSTSAGTTTPVFQIDKNGNATIGGNGTTLTLPSVAASSLLALNSSNQLVATTSIGTNLLTGTLGTINGQALTAGGSITVASTTLLANNNTFSGTDAFTNALDLNGGFLSLASSTVVGNFTTTGTVQFTGLGSGFVGSSGGTFYSIASSSITAASSTLLADANSWTDLQSFANASTTFATVSNLWLPNVSTNSLLKVNGSGQVAAAVAGTDYQSPITSTYPIQFSGNNLSLAFGTTTSNLWGGTQTFTNPIIVNGTGTSTFAGDISISGNIVPTSDQVYSLGSPTDEWKDLYVGSGSLYVNGQEVVHTDVGDNVVVSADSGENLILKSQGSGSLQLDSSGTGNIQLQGSTQITGGDAFTTSNGTPVLFTNGTEPGNLELTGNTIQATNTNGGISITPAGNGGTYITNGNVGIGTTNPGSKLEVEGTVAAQSFSATSTTATSTFADGITLTAGCVFYNGSCIGANSGTVNGGTQGQFAFYATNGTTISATSTLFATQAGNIGLGTTSAGIISGANRYLTIASGNGSNSLPALELAGNANTSNSTLGRIDFINQTGGSNTDNARISVSTAGGDTSNGALVFSTEKSGVLNESARIDQNGNLGIGTSTPGSILSVQGVGNFVASATSTLYNALTIGGNLSLNINNSLLSTNASGQVVATSSIGTNLLTGTLGVGNGGTGINSTPSYGNILVGNGTNYTPTATSSLGLGNGTFLGLKDTIGSYNANRILYEGSSAVTDNSGFTFDGTTLTAPLVNSTLGYEQNGSLILYASSTNHATLAGVNAGGSDSTSNSAVNNDSAFGFDALQDEVSGSSNVALGNFALSLGSSSSFTDNTAVGYSAGRYASAANSTEVGTYANEGSSVTNYSIGSYNSAFGYTALRYGSTGSNNAAIGAYALSGFSGSNSFLDETALGYNAGNSDTAGSLDTYIGYDSGYIASSTTAHNTFVGAQAGIYASSSLSASDNTFLGYQAGAGGSAAYDTGYYNTFLGYGSGDDVTSGYENTFLGACTGATCQSQVSSGAQNISIGYNVALPSPTLSGQLDIGNEIYGTGITGTGSTLSTGNIGIGTSTPGSILSVQGVGNFVASATSTLYNALTIGGNLSLNINNSLLSTNASGQVVATSSIGTNLLTGTLGTINGQALTAGGTITVASTTLLANNNTWTGLQQFANASTTLGSISTLWLPNVTGNSLLATNTFGQVVATSSIGTNLLTGTLGVGNGGTGISSTPSYGNILLGNGSGYTLTATSSLGISIPGITNGSGSVTTNNSWATVGTNPTALAFDTSGNLYVANYGSGTVSKVTSGGSVSTFATVGTNPTALAFDTSGNLYVANYGSGTVSKVTSGGSVSTFATVGTNPTALAFDTSGNLYVANYGSGTVSKVTSGGSVSTFATVGTNPTALAFDTSGNLYVANYGSGTVSKVTSGGSVSTFATVGTNPTALAFDTSGNLYVANEGSGTVSKVTSGGSVSTFATVGANPAALAFDTSGNLYVANLNHTVSKVTPGGTVTTFATVGSGPDALAFDSSGNLYVANSNGTTVSQIAVIPGSLTFSYPSVFTDGLSFFGTASFGATATSTFASNGALSLVSNGLTVGTNQLVVSGGNLGIGTSTPGSILSIGTTNGINFSTATSTFNSTGGINLASGCFSINGTCIGGGGGGTYSAGAGLSLSGSAFSLNLGNSNWWTAPQNFTNATTSAFEATSTDIYLDSFKNDLLGVNSSGQLVATTSIGTNLLTGTLGVGNGGTGTSTGGVTNGIEYYSGTTLTNGANLTTDSLGDLAAAGQVTAQTGSAGAPGYAFAGSPTYGIWLNGTSLSFTTNGTARITVNSNGLNSQNGTGPNIVNGTGASLTAPVLVPDRSDSTTGFGAGVLSNLDTIIGGVETSRWTSVGYGIGTSTPGSILSVQGVGNFVASATSTLYNALTIGGNLSLNINNSLLSTNASGQVVATSSIGTNLLTGTLGTINGQALTAGGTITVASTTLLANNNTWTGLQQFANATSSLLSATTAWIGTLNLTNALGVGSGGTGISATPSYGQLLLGNGSGYTLTATSSLGISIPGITSVATSTASAKNSWATVGSGSYPDALAFDTSGNLYVANSGNNTVSEVTPGGTVSTFATVGSEPIALAFDTSGNLYVANNGSGTVSKVTPGGTVSTFATVGTGPQALAFDTSGNLYVANGVSGTVSKVTPGGTVSTFATVGTGLIALAFDTSGNLYVANWNSGTVSEVTPGGSVSTFATVGTNPTALAFDTSGNLYVANYGSGTVSKVTPGGTVSTFATVGSNPDALAFDTSGNLYVANYGSGTVSKVTPGGTVSTFATVGSNPYALAFDSSGNLYVENYGSGTVSKVSIYSAYIGIGTASPDQVLTVNGNVDLASGDCYMVAGSCIGQMVGLAGIFATSTATAAPGSNVPVTFSSSVTVPTWTGSALELPSTTAYYVVEMWGGGGGGTYTSTVAPTVGGSSCYGTNSTACTSPLMTAGGGGAASGSTDTGTGGTGGTASGGSVNISGAPGASGSVLDTGANGGNSPRGGQGGADPKAAAASNPGSLPGGGGSGGRASAADGGEGGGGGAYSETLITSQTASYYTVGTGGTGGTGTDPGGAGAAGGMVVYDYTTSANGADYAENYPTDDPGVSAGDIVSFDASTSGEIKLAQQGDAALAGVVSTQPGQVIGETGADAVDERPVALAGRVPVEVNLENGPIAIGDRIALSSIPGVGKKAGPFDDSVGIAMESYDGTARSSEITVLIDLQKGVDINALALGLLGNDASLFVNPLASSTSATSSTSTATSSLDFVGGMMNAFASRLNAFAFDTGTTTPILTFASSTSSTDGYAAGFLNSLLSELTQWFASAENGIGDFFATTIHTKELCVSDDSGSSTCITKAQLDQLLANAASAGSSGGSSSNSGGSSSSSSSGGSGSDIASTSAPVLQVNGNDPATIQVGANYTDLGAQIIGPTADLNLGIEASVDGATSTPLSGVTIDTSQPGQHTILYSATDQNGLVGTAERTVNIIAPQTSDDSGSSATSTSDQGPDATSTPPSGTTVAASSTSDDSGSADPSSGDSSGGTSDASSTESSLIHS